MDDNFSLLAILGAFAIVLSLIYPPLWLVWIAVFAIALIITAIKAMAKSVRG